MNDKQHQQSRRDFIKKVGYVAPVILTLKAAPSFASIGSKTQCDRDKPDRYEES